jgi:hypothetical protein
MAGVSENSLFHSLLAIQGREVELTKKSNGQLIRGILANVMFDSCLIQSSKSSVVVAFSDLLYLDPVD